MQSIFTNTKVFEYSDPLTSFIFDVSFYRYDGTNGAYVEFFKNVIPISITLPEFKTQTVTKKFFGTEKTFPVLRTYGKDVTMSFNLYSELDSNKNLDWFTQINALRGHDKVVDTRTVTANQLSDSEKASAGTKDADHYDVTTTTMGGKLAYHPELSEVSSGYDFIGKFNAVVVNVKNKKGEPVYSLRYKHCTVTNFEFENELNYDSDGKLRCKLTFHSDIWDFVPVSTQEVAVAAGQQTSNSGVKGQKGHGGYR